VTSSGLPDPVLARAVAVPLRRRIDADSFMAFARSLPCGLDNPRGERLMLTDLVDFDMCCAFDLVDPGKTSTSSIATTE